MSSNLTHSPPKAQHLTLPLAHLLFPVMFAAVSSGSWGLHERPTPHATLLGRNDQMTFSAWTGHPIKSLRREEGQQGTGVSPGPPE